MLQQLMTRFDTPGVDALVLMGSHARGTQQRYSDVDLARFTNAHGHGRTRAFQGLIGDQLVIVNDLGDAAVEDIFTQPEVACSYLAGLRHGQALCDRQGVFARIQARAQAFTWDAAMQAKANAWASEELMGWGEDMRKGLAGLFANDIGMLLNARFASSWGLSRIMQVQRGVLLASGNDFFDAVNMAMELDSAWVRLRQLVFAITTPQGYTPALREQVLAGLLLYRETARCLQGVLRQEDEDVIWQTVQLIEEALPQLPETPVIQAIMSI